MGDYRGLSALGRAGDINSRLAARKSPDNLDRLHRLAWLALWLLLYRFSPTPLHAWRRIVLSAFGAKIGKRAHPYPSARIWAPWNLKMGDDSCLGGGVECYNVDVVELGAGAIVSQRAFLCTASHDYNSVGFALVSAPISIGANAWVAAEAFIGPGVTVGEGAVVGARSVVTDNPAPWTVVAGNPAKLIRQRTRR